MAQDFRNNLQRNVGTSPVTLITAGDFDAVIGIRICNVTTSTVLASCQIVNGGNDHFIAKNVSVPPNSAIELIQGGAKIVLANGCKTLFAVPITAFCSTIQNGIERIFAASPKGTVKYPPQHIA